MLTRGGAQIAASPTVTASVFTENVLRTNARVTRRLASRRIRRAMRVAVVLADILTASRTHRMPALSVQGTNTALRIQQAHSVLRFATTSAGYTRRHHLIHHHHHRRITARVAAAVTATKIASRAGDDDDGWNSFCLDYPVRGKIIN